MSVKLGDGTKPQYEYKGQFYTALNLEQYSILEQKMRQDVIDNAVESLSQYQINEEGRATIIDRAYSYRARVAITSEEGLKLLDTATYQRYIVELSLQSSSNGTLSREQCRQVCDKMSLSDIVTISRNLLIIDNLYTDLDHPDWRKNTEKVFKQSMADTMELLNEIEEELKHGDIAKKNELKEPEESSKKETLEKSPK